MERRTIANMNTEDERRDAQNRITSVRWGIRSVIVYIIIFMTVRFIRSDERAFLSVGDTAFILLFVADIYLTVQKGFLAIKKRPGSCWTAGIAGCVLLLMMIIGRVILNLVPPFWMPVR